MPDDILYPSDPGFPPGGGPNDSPCSGDIVRCGLNQHIETGPNGCLICVDDGPTPTTIQPTAGNPPPGVTCSVMPNGCYLCSDGNTYCSPPCSSPGGGGGGGGDGGGEPPQDPQNTCPVCDPCRYHDGRVIDSSTKADVPRDPDCCRVGFCNVPTYCGIAVDALPYCDDKSCDGPPAEPISKTCDECVSRALKDIGETLKKLLDRLVKCFDSNGDIVGECLDKIVKKVVDKILPPAKNCDQCCERLKLGLGEIATSAAVCANCACDNCADKCESWMEGQCCKNCGKANCTCKEGKCVGEDKPTETWYGWCDKDSGFVIAQSDTGPPKGEGNWSYAGEFPTYEAAFNAAQAKCQQQPEEPTPQPPKPLPPITPLSPIFASADCAIGGYGDSGKASQLLAELNVQAFAFQMENVGRNVLKNLLDDVAWIPVAGDVTQALVTESQSPIAYVNAYLPFINAMTGCGYGESQNGIFAMAMAGVISKNTGFDMSQYMLPVEYAINTLCRHRQLSPTQAVSAVLSGSLDIKDLDSYYAMNGYCPGVSAIDLHASKAKPIPMELTRLRRREMIDETQFNTGMRQLGYIDQIVVDQLYKLSEYIPGPQDIVRFMKRDVDDSTIVDRFQLDADFTKKFGSGLKRYADSQGVDETLMKYEWRSHWDIPSPTALFEMFRRLRGAETPETARVTDSDIRLALEQQDIAPFWIDKYLALSYEPLGRIDIRRSYQNGTLSVDETKQALGYLGYSPDNAKRLMVFFDRLKEQAAKNHYSLKLWLQGIIDSSAVIKRMEDDGYTHEQAISATVLFAPRFITSPPAKSYQAGQLTTDQFKSVMSGLGVPVDIVTDIIKSLSYSLKDKGSVDLYSIGLLTHDDAVDKMVRNGVDSKVAAGQLDDANTKIFAASVKRCINSIRKRYLAAEIDIDQARSSITARGVNEAFAASLLSAWGCEASAKGKKLTVQQLCGALGRGTIGSVDFVDRLKLLGYKDDDAKELLGDCLGRVNSALAKQEAAKVRESEADQRKAEAAARRSKAEAEKALAKSERMLKQKAALKRGRQAQIAHAATLLIKHCLCDAQEAAGAVISAYENAQAEFGLSIDEALQATVQAAETWGGGPASDFIGRVSAISKTLAETERTVEQIAN